MDTYLRISEFQESDLDRPETRSYKDGGVVSQASDAGAEVAAAVESVMTLEEEVTPLSSDVGEGEVGGAAAAAGATAAAAAEEVVVENLSARIECAGEMPGVAEERLMTRENNVEKESEGKEKNDDEEEKDEEEEELEVEGEEELEVEEPEDKNVENVEEERGKTDEKAVEKETSAAMETLTRSDDKINDEEELVSLATGADDNDDNADNNDDVDKAPEQQNAENVGKDALAEMTGKTLLVKDVVSTAKDNVEHDLEQHSETKELDLTKTDLDCTDAKDTSAPMTKTPLSVEVASS